MSHSVLALWVTPRDVQRLLLALCSGVATDSMTGDCVMLGLNQEVQILIPGKYIPPCTTGCGPDDLTHPKIFGGGLLTRSSPHSQHF